jgi:hypothetical protein
MSVPAKIPTPGDIMESVLLKGDIGKLTPDERVKYYGEVCRSMGLNPLTKPFEFITLNGKLQLYALRTCADQLRKINGVSLEIVSREIAHDILTIHVRAKLPDGRSDEDLGAVAFPDSLKGEARANAELKAVTKAKRRATLSICGLGWLDETEVEDIPASAKRPAPPAKNVMLPLHDPNTGEIEPASQHNSGDTAAEKPAPFGAEHPQSGAGEDLDSGAVKMWDDALAIAATIGTAKLESKWNEVPSDIKPTLKSALDRRHKPRARTVDTAKAPA